MRIKWPNVIVVAVVVTVLILAIKTRQQIGDVLRTLGHRSRWCPPEDQTIGLMGLGLICLTVVALARVLRDGRRRPPPP